MGATVAVSAKERSPSAGSQVHSEHEEAAESEKDEEDPKETERFLKMTQKERGLQFTEWLIEQERKFLEECAKLVKSGGRWDMQLVKSMRQQIRVPAMYRKFALDDEQMQEVERRQQEQAEEFRERVLRMIEMGSDYSSDYEEVEVSELISNASVGRLSENEPLNLVAQQDSGTVLPGSEKGSKPQEPIR